MHSCASVFGPKQLNKCYMKEPLPQAICSVNLEASNCFSLLFSQSSCQHGDSQQIRELRNCELWAANREKVSARSGHLLMALVNEKDYEALPLLTAQ